MIILNAVWYTSYKLYRAGQEHFHLLFTIFGPYAIPAYAHFFQAHPRYNLSLRTWTLYSLAYWGLLLGTRDLVEYLTIGSPFLDDVSTVLRITLAVFWFPMLREGLAGTLRNIWYFITWPLSQILRVLSAALQAIAACCLWLAGWQQEVDTQETVASIPDATPTSDNTINQTSSSNDSRPAANTGGSVASVPDATPVQDDNNEPNDSNGAGTPGNMLNLARFLLVAPPVIGILLYYCGFTGILESAAPLICPFWILSLFHRRTLHVFLNSPLHRMRNNPIKTGLFLAHLLYKLAGKVIEWASSDSAHWLVYSLLPAMFKARWLILHHVFSIFLIVFALKTRKSTKLHEFAQFARAACENGFRHVSWMARVYTGLFHRRIAPIHFGAYGLVHATLFNAGLLPPGTFSVRDTIKAVISSSVLSVREAVAATILPAGGLLIDGNDKLHLALIVTGLSWIIFGSSFLVSSILGCSAICLTGGLITMYGYRKPISSWLLILMTPVFVITAPQVGNTASRSLALIWSIVVRAYLSQRYLVPRTPASPAARHQERTNPAAQTTQVLPAIASTTPSTTITTPPLPSSSRLRKALSTLLLLGLAALAFATFTVFPHVNPYAILGFPTGFRFTNVDLRQAYRAAARPFHAGGEPAAFDRAVQGKEAYQMLADPESTCEYLARHDTPIWSRWQASRRCSEDAVAVVGPPAELAWFEVNLWLDEELVTEIIHLGQVCYVDGAEVRCEYPWLVRVKNFLSR